MDNTSALNTGIETYLSFCKSRKNLDFKTIKSYATDLKQFNLNNETEILSFVQGDPSPYIQKKTVRKNVTIPEWLASRGEKDHANFSQILTDALFKKYG